MHGFIDSSIKYIGPPNVAFTIKCGLANKI